MWTQREEQKAVLAKWYNYSQCIFIAGNTFHLSLIACCILAMDSMALDFFSMPLGFQVCWDAL